MATAVSTTSKTGFIKLLLTRVSSCEPAKEAKKAMVQIMVASFQLMVTFFRY